MAEGFKEPRTDLVQIGRNNNKSGQDEDFKVQLIGCLGREEELLGWMKTGRLEKGLTEREREMLAPLKSRAL